MKIWAWLLLGAAVVIGIMFLPIPRRGHAQVPSITIVWTSPGDDGNVGTATSYQIKYRTVGIVGTDTLSWWNAATLVTPSPVPKVAGTADSTVVQGPFVGGSTVYFLMKACDEVPNCSGYSNLASKAILDTVPPGRIIDLFVR